MSNRIPTKWLYLPVILLFINFFYRIINQGKMLKYFPVDYNNDGSSYMAQLFFLKTCGFHNFCSYWYNGFVNFLHSPPGWYLFTLPIFNLFQIVNVATYLSMILMFIISFLIVYFLYGKIGLTRFERTVFFIFFFGNAIAIGNFIKLIRVHELFAWMNFLLFFFLIFYFKDKKIDWRYSLVIPSYAFILLSYQSVGAIASILFLSIFLVKKGRERIYVLLSAVTPLIITSFWWIPFVLRINEGGILGFQQAIWVWRFDTLNLYTSIFAAIIPIVLFILFYIYFKQSNNKKWDLFFYLPILLLNLIFFLRLHPFIPIFGNIFPDPYLVFFIFFIIFLFFKINFLKYKFLRFVPYILLILIIISISFNIFRTPFFVEPNSDINKEIEFSLSNVNGSFVLLGDFGSKIHSKGIYSYAPTKYNISTSSGWYPEVVQKDYLENLNIADESFNKRDCGTMIKTLIIYNTTEIISLDSGCKFLNDCGLREKVKKEHVCL